MLKDLRARIPRLQSGRFLPWILLGTSLLVSAFVSLRVKNDLDHASAWATFAGGLLISGLLFVLLRMCLNTRGKAVRIADQQTADALAESEIFKQSILDSLPAEIAVVDHSGKIVAVNQPWRQYATESGVTPGETAAAVDVGANYIAVCQAGIDFIQDGALESSMAASGIRAVLDGRLPSFSMEYPCHTPQKQQWFFMVVMPMGKMASGGAVIAHTNITPRKLAENQLAAMAGTLEKQVDERTRQLRQVTAELTMAEERERHRLAQELHDNLSQLLAAIKIRLSSLGAGRADTFQPSLDEIVVLVEQANRAVRMITMQLSPPTLRILGFVPALEGLVEEMRHTYGLKVDIYTESQPQRLDDVILAVLFRSARELLINVAKHAGVNDASLSYRADDKQLTLLVSDDGCGFDPEPILSMLSAKQSFGLRSINERIVALGGRMEIDSNPGFGCMVILTLPLPIITKETSVS